MEQEPEPPSEYREMLNRLPVRHEHWQHQSDSCPFVAGMPHNVVVRKGLSKNMATDKQIAANRANALKSTGPKTPEGKAESSRNAARYKSLAKSYVLKSECSRRFKDFVESFHAEYHPSTPTETALVNFMATAQWRLTRMSNLESAVIDYEYACDSESANLSPPIRATLAWRRASAIQ